MEGACLNRFPFHFVSEIPASAGMTMEGTGMTMKGGGDDNGGNEDDNEGAEILLMVFFI